MENIEIPDDFYVYKGHNYNTLCHKSCVIRNGEFSNYKFLFINKLISNEMIIKLRYKCNTIDEIEERTYFVDNAFKNLSYTTYYSGDIILYKTNKIFNNVNDFIDYLAENYPECIRNNDIKIALKD